MGSQQNGVSDELASSLEKSNLGNLFGGGQAYVPPSEQQAHGEVEAKDEGELPPPSN
jgi:hypothetical protein